MTFSLDSLESHLREVASTVLDLRSGGHGREVLGAVPGRPEAEDVAVGVDLACQSLLQKWIRESGLDAELYSEHHVPQPGRRTRYIIASDPFDGSALFARGVPAEWWSVLSIYDASTLEPVAGGAVDILRRELYLAGPDGVTLVEIGSGRRTKLAPSRKTALDDSTVIAAYIMNPSYLSAWTRMTRRLLQSLEARGPKVRVWPNGGSCIYPWLARGIVHAYMMFNEPRSEVDPGLAFAHAAGYPVFEVGRGGKLTPYGFQPEQMHEGRVPFFIAACTEELAGEIVDRVRGR